MAIDTALKMVDGSEQYGVVLIADQKNDGKVIQQYEIDLPTLQAIQAGKPVENVPDGCLAFVYGKPLRTGEAMLLPDGQLAAKTGEGINRSGVNDCEIVKLYPEEFTFDGVKIAVTDAVAAAIPVLENVSVAP